MKSISREQYWAWLALWAEQPDRVGLRGILRRGDCFCPLGLLADMVAPEDWMLHTNYHDGAEEQSYRWRGVSAHPGLLPPFWEYEITELNDTLGPGVAFDFAWRTGPILYEYGFLDPRRALNFRTQITRARKAARRGV